MNDFSEYDSEKCRNGGCYGFWTDYDLLENGLFKVSHGTTSDLEYCPVCGGFNNHYEGDGSYHESGYSCGEFETITKNELMKLISVFKETDDKYIEIKSQKKGDMMVVE